MSFLSRFFGMEADPREELQPLWHRIIGIARETQWYADCGVADTIEGRFDMVCAVLSFALVRMEGDEQLAKKTGLLTEFFVEDMDGQLRQSGVGDLMVGKNIGNLMSTLGGRIGAYRSAAAADDPVAALAEAATRNVELADTALAQDLARRLVELEQRLGQSTAEQMLAGEAG
jgi:cytochrome b pre-mRNA-processing protein 3